MSRSGKRFDNGPKRKTYDFRGSGPFDFGLFGQASWSALGSGVGGSSPYVGSLLTDTNGRLIVGGRFTTAGGAPANYISKHTTDSQVPGLLLPGVG
jgi:hypothetical protein